MLSINDEDIIFECADKYCVEALKENPEVIKAYSYFDALTYSLERGNTYMSRKRVKANKTQVEQILEHLRKAGSITMQEAYLQYGVTSFFRRLTDIEEMGHRLIRIRKVHPVTGQEYTKVKLYE